VAKNWKWQPILVEAAHPDFNKISKNGIHEKVNLWPYVNYILLQISIL
jgi:hypothetical protein